MGFAREAELPDKNRGSASRIHPTSKQHGMNRHASVPPKGLSTSDESRETLQSLRSENLPAPKAHPGLSTSQTWRLQWKLVQVIDLRHWLQLALRLPLQLPSKHQVGVGLERKSRRIVRVIMQLRNHS